MSDSKGQSLMELVVVIAVMVVVVGALTFATIASLRNAQFSKNQAQATKLAQEALEWVRTGRDRNSPISNILSTSVVSWNGTGANDAIWDYHISGSREENCDYELVSPDTAKKCYFKVSPDGSLQNIGYQSASFPTSLAEAIPPSPATAVFKRAVSLSDDINDNRIFSDSDDDWHNIKKVTAIVIWTDFSGSHQSILTTILRKL